MGQWRSLMQTDIRLSTQGFMVMMAHMHSVNGDLRCASRAVHSFRFALVRVCCTLMRGSANSPFQRTGGLVSVPAPIAELLYCGSQALRE